jgi:hypothetical protein
VPHIVRPHNVRRIVAALLGSALMLVAVPSLAEAACKSTPASAVFKPFGDTALYSLVPGGSFESGAPGWSLTNSAIVSESSKVTGGSHALAIQPTGVAVSPALCVSIENPSFRFFARQTSGSWAVLNVILLWTEASGSTHETTVGSLQTDTAWALSPVLKLGSDLPLWQAGESLSVKLKFKPEQYGGAWAIDDVYVDPYAR